MTFEGHLKVISVKVVLSTCSISESVRLSRRAVSHAIAELLVAVISGKLKLVFYKRLSTRDRSRTRQKSSQTRQNRHSHDNFELCINITVWRLWLDADRCKAFIKADFEAVRYSPQAVATCCLGSSPIAVSHCCKNALSSFSTMEDGNGRRSSIVVDGDNETMRQKVPGASADAWAPALTRETCRFA